MIKKWFATPKKAVLTIVCALLILTVSGAGTVYAVSAVAKNTSIGAEKAEMFAYADAGVDPAAAENVRVEFDFEHGQFIYDVEFTAGGTEYEYWIHASDGTVVKKSIEIITAEGTVENITATITQREAKEIALMDAGLSEQEVTVTSEKLEVNNGISVYEIGFFKDNVKYEYEINAGTGAIYSKSKETIVLSSADDTVQPDGEQNPGNTITPPPASESTKPQVQEDSAAYIGLDTAKSIALSDAGVSASAVTFTKARLDTDDRVKTYDIEFFSSTHEYDYEINALTGGIVDKSVEVIESTTRDLKPDSASVQANESMAYIGVDKAKSIALSHAGLSVSSVSFSKAKLDDDDGRIVYEIEFYVGNTEYDYEIDAYSGAILEYEIDND